MQKYIVSVSKMNCHICLDDDDKYDDWDLGYFIFSKACR